MQYYDSSHRAGRLSPPRRYLIKALREVGQQVAELVVDLDQRELRWRPEDGEWCANEIVGFLRDSEREDLLAVRAIVARDGARVEERRALHGPAEHDYRLARVEELVWDFETLREEMVWALREAGPGWDHAGEHSFRGRIPLERWVHEISDRDLEATWSLRRLREQLRAGVVL